MGLRACPPVQACSDGRWRGFPPQLGLESIAETGDTWRGSGKEARNGFEGSSAGTGVLRPRAALTCRLAVEAWAGTTWSVWWSACSVESSCCEAVIAQRRDLRGIGAFGHCGRISCAGPLLPPLHYDERAGLPSGVACRPFQA